MTQRSVGDLLQRIAVGRRVDHRHHRRQQQHRQAAIAGQREHPGDDKGDESADHVYLAMGEVDQLNDSVNHRVAQGNQRVDAALNDSAAEQLKQILKIHGSTVVDCDKEGSFDTARTVQHVAPKDEGGQHRLQLAC